jgi:hypothetical protein
MPLIYYRRAQDCAGSTIDAHLGRNLVSSSAPKCWLIIHFDGMPWLRWDFTPHARYESASNRHGVRTHPSNVNSSVCRGRVAIKAARSSVITAIKPDDFSGIVGWCGHHKSPCARTVALVTTELKPNQLTSRIASERKNPGTFGSGRILNFRWVLRRLRFISPLPLGLRGLVFRIAVTNFTRTQVEYPYRHQIVIT